MSEREEALKAIAAANAVVGELCEGHRQWIMSIPARPDFDPDLVIGNALHLAEKMIRALEAQLAHEEAENAVSEELIKRSRTRIAALEARAEARVCEWTLDDPDFGAWHTGCGHLFEFIADGPSENGAKFCQYCGGTLNALTGGASA